MISRTAIYAKALLDSWERASANEGEKIIGRFIELLRADRLLPLVPNIIKTLEQLITEKAKAQEITVEVAHELTSQVLESMKRFQVTKVKHSPDVIGGFKITGENRIIDASVKGGLQQMRQALILE